MSDFILQNVPATPATLAGYSAFWGGIGLGSLGPLTSSSTTGWILNQASVWMFFLVLPITISKATVNITTTLLGGNISAGVYSLSGTKLVDTGTFSTTTGGVKTNTFTSTLLPSGWYYFNFTASSASIGITYFQNFATAGIDNLLNQNPTTPRVGTATATSGGAQNASLGTVSSTAAGNSFSMPAVLFE